MRLGEMLIEGAAGDEAHHLHTEADPEHGDIVVTLEFAEQSGLELLSIIEHTDGFGMGWVSEWFGDGVVSPCEDECVESFDEIGDVHRRGGDDDGDPSGGEDRMRIGHC